MIGPLGPKPLGRDGRFAEPPALAFALRDPEPFFAPEPLHPLAVHLPAQLTQTDGARGGTPTAVAPSENFRSSRAQRRIIIGPHRLVTLSGARLPDHPACPALADGETVAKHRDRLAPAGRAYQFPRAISFNAWFSST